MSETSPATGAELAPPFLVFRGTEWPSPALARLAWRWCHAVVGRGVVEPSGLLALVMANHPESVALFFGLSALPVHLILLPADRRAWCSWPPIPPGTPLVLTPGQADLAPAGLTLGMAPLLLPPAADEGPAPPAAGSFLTARGAVFFTSGFTAAPKPVCRSFAGFVAGAGASIQGYGLRPGDGIIATLPLSHSHGLVQVLIVASLLRSEVGLLEQFDHRATLALFRSARYGYWPSIPLMADAMSRIPIAESLPRAPRICTVTGGGLPPAIFAAFRDRFGVPLRSAYGATEAGLIAVAQDDEVDPDCVGPPVPGVSLRIGDDPGWPAGAGEPGRVWVRSPWYADGYGFPPALDPPEARDGWYATRDLGAIDGRGRLVVLGRLDDCFKTANGHLINPTHIAAVARRCPGVKDAQAVPVPGAPGAAIGLLVTGPGITADEVRRHVVLHLPSWSWPRDVLVTPELPRLPGGKVDPVACAALLSGGESAGGGARPVP